MAYVSTLGLSAGQPSSALVAGGQSLDSLKFDAASAGPKAIKETAKQLESLFMRELIKSMREATAKSGLMDNPGTDLGSDLLDQQFAVQMSGQPRGLSDLIAAQLQRQMPATNTAEKVPQDALAAAGVPVPKSHAHKARPATPTQASFVQKHSETANRIEKASGIPAGFMLGQAGHETGWGQFEIKHKGGAPSFNLFGIKAGSGWTGKVAEVTTTEYVNGVAQKRVARFRAYDSYEASFKDYAKLISDSPRYAQARSQTGSALAYASGLQKAGYATDPDYAAKLSRAINTTLQLRRVQVQV